MFLKNINIIFKIRRSKVTDYEALRLYLFKGTTDHIYFRISLFEFKNAHFFKLKTARKSELSYYKRCFFSYW